MNFDVNMYNKYTNYKIISTYTTIPIKFINYLLFYLYTVEPR